MQFKHSFDDELVPRDPNGFVPIDQVADTALSPDEALMAKEEGELSFDQPVPKNDGTDRYPIEREFGDEERKLPNFGSEVSDRGAAEEEDLDRKSLLEQLREWWNKDQNVARNPSHVPKKDRPKGAETIRGTDWTPADDAPVDKMDEAA